MLLELLGFLHEWTFSGEMSGVFANVADSLGPSRPIPVVPLVVAVVLVTLVIIVVPVIVPIVVVAFICGIRLVPVTAVLFPWAVPSILIAYKNLQFGYLLRQFVYGIAGLILATGVLEVGPWAIRGLLGLPEMCVFFIRHLLPNDRRTVSCVPPSIGRIYQLLEVSDLWQGVQPLSQFWYQTIAEGHLNDFFLCGFWESGSVGNL
jgi:hypothetical protein